MFFQDDFYLLVIRCSPLVVSFKKPRSIVPEVLVIWDGKLEVSLRYS